MNIKDGGQEILLTRRWKKGGKKRTKAKECQKMQKQKAPTESRKKLKT